MHVKKGAKLANKELESPGKILNQIIRRSTFWITVITDLDYPLQACLADWCPEI